MPGNFIAVNPWDWDSNDLPPPVVRGRGDWTSPQLIAGTRTKDAEVWADIGRASFVLVRGACTRCHDWVSPDISISVVVMAEDNLPRYLSKMITKTPLVGSTSVKCQCALRVRYDR